MTFCLAEQIFQISLFICLNIYFPLNGEAVFESLVHFVCNVFAIYSGCRPAAVCTSVNGGAEWSADVANRKFLVPFIIVTLFIIFFVS
jgi:hypothetical protein